MPKKKPHHRCAVKKRTTSLSETALNDLHSRLRENTISWDLAGKGRPPWFDALDSLDIDRGHPVAEQVEAVIREHPRLRRRWRQVFDRIQVFHDQLPGGHKILWQEIERLHHELSATESAIYFCLGVNAGKDSVVVESALTSGGVDVAVIEPKVLFRLTVLIGELARRLPLKAVAA